MPALTLSKDNLALVNHMRIAAQKASSDFDILKFFADRDYARACVSRLLQLGVPEVAALAVRAGQVLGQPQPAAARQPTTPARPARGPGAAAGRQPVSAGADHCFDAAQQLMRRAATEAGGLRAGLFLRQLDQARNREQLLGLAEPFHALLARRAGDLVAFTMTQRVTRLLGLEP